MGYMFGKEEKLQCIVDVPLKGPKDEALCVAYKTTVYAVFAPAYFHDDGYVLALKDRGNDYYPMPEGTELSALQASGSLPSPLPPYQIPLFDYAFGYLLWGALAAGLALQYASERFKARRHASLQSNLPPSTGQPELRTKTDRWLGQEVAKLLQPGELVQQQAYGLDREANSTLGAASIRALYLVLTDRRLLVIHARVGAFGPCAKTEAWRSTLAPTSCGSRAWSVMCASCFGTARCSTSSPSGANGTCRISDASCATSRAYWACRRPPLARSWRRADPPPGLPRNRFLPLCYASR
jgi:hypothetical protein